MLHHLTVALDNDGAGGHHGTVDRCEGGPAAKYAEGQEDDQEASPRGGLPIARRILIVAHCPPGPQGRQFRLGKIDQLGKIYQLGKIDQRPCHGLRLRKEFARR